MAITLHKKVKEEKPNNCKAIITTNNSNIFPPNSPISYFLSITIPQPKMKIKVPKLIVKAMQRKNHGSCKESNDDDDDDDQSKKKKKKKHRRRKWATAPRKLKRVGSLISNVFSSKKSWSEQNKCRPSSNDVGSCSRSDRVQVHDNSIGEKFAGSSKDEGAGTEDVLENDDHMWSVKTSSCSGNSLQFVVDQHVRVSKSCSLKDILKIEDDQQGKKKKKKKKKKKPSLKSSLSFSSFFNKRTSFNFSKGKINKTRASSSANGGIGNASYSVNKKQEISCNLAGVDEVKMARKVKFTGKKSKKRVEEQREKGDEEGELEERGDDELCKKRILMGEKCKPLHASGALHYDRNGVLLPEQVIQ